ACFQAGRTVQAQKVASALSAGAHNVIQLHCTLGVILAAAEQYKSAQSEFEKENALRPEDLDILFNLAQAYLRSADFSNAELVAKRAQALKPDSPDALYLLAQIYNDQSRPVDALELLVRAHKLAPETLDVIYLLS